MQGPDYIFALQDKDFNFWKFTPDGAPIKSADPYLLDFSPEGWEDIAIQNIRNRRYWGVDRKVSIPLSYLNDGAKILKHIFYNIGIYQPVYLVIASQRMDYTPGESYGYWYKKIYRAEVDLSSLIHDGARVTCATIEDGLPKYLKANENTIREFPMNVPEAIMVKMDGINLAERLNYAYLDGLSIAIGQGNGQMLPAIFLNNDGNSTGVTHNSQTYAVVPISSNVFEAGQTNNFLVNNGSTPITFTIKGQLQFKGTQRTATQAVVRHWVGIGSDGNTVSATPVTPIHQVEVGTVYTYPLNFTFTIQPNEYAFIYGISTIIGTSAAYEFTAESLMTIEFKSRYRPTYVRAFRAQYLFAQLISTLTEGTYAAAAAAYFAEYTNVVFTSGNAIRLLDDATIKICWSDFFQFWDCFDAVGISSKENIIDFAAKQNLIDLTNLIDLPEPSSDTFKVSLDKSYLFNELEYGYPEIKNDVGVLNGNEEFNTKFLFSVGSTVAPEKLDKVSKIKASCYEIENIRITTFAKDTTDYKADNDNFVLHIESTLQPATIDTPAHYQLDRSLNATAEGLLEPETVFNLFLSPGRCRDRNGAFLRSSLSIGGELLTLGFCSADKNSNLVCDGLVENESKNVGSFDPKFFVPVLFDGEFPAPEDLLQQLDQNPLQAFRFPFEGDYYIGIMVKSGISPSSRKTQAYQLMSIAGNPLHKLVDYYGG